MLVCEGQFKLSIIVFSCTNFLVRYAIVSTHCRSFLVSIALQLISFTPSPSLSELHILCKELIGDNVQS